MSDPEKKEPIDQAQEKFKKADALLNPTFENSAILYQEIDNDIYLGTKDYEERTERVKTSGYDPELLARKGKETKDELEALYKESSRRSLSEEERSRLDLLQGLVTSKTGPEEKNFSRHSDLSIGLAYELVRQMRKINNFLYHKE